MNAIVTGALSSAGAQRVGWALVHFLWQGTVVALSLALVFHLMWRRSPQARWALSCAALGLMMLLPAATALLVTVEGPIPGPPPAPATAAAPALPAVTEAIASEFPTSAGAGGPAGQPAPVPSVPLAAPWHDRMAAVIEPGLPWIVLAWLAGVLGLSTWYLGGWWHLERSKRTDTRPVAAEVAAAFRRLARQLRVSRTVRLLGSARVAVPMVVGWLRPVILLPATAVTGLTADQLEAVLAHELAHIRRCDCLVRLLQAAVETLLFYHPAVWWVSGRIRQESELCCDELALAVCPDRRGYAYALASVATRGRGEPRASVAASGGRLLDRIRRIIGFEEAKEVNSSRWLAGLLTALVVVILVAGPAMRAVASDAASEPAEPGAAQNIEEPEVRFAATLPNGVTVELVGVSYYPSKGKQWWRPDGTTLQEAPGYSLSGTVRGPVKREFVLRMSNIPPGGFGVRARSPHARGAVQGTFSGTETASGALGASFPEGLQSCSVQVGVAAGSWYTRARSDGEDRLSVELGDGGLVFGAAEPDGNGTRIRVSHDLNDSDVRIVAFDKAGRLHTPNSVTTSGVGSVSQPEAFFRDLAPEEVEEFRLQTRPVHGVEFRNVSLEPGHKTEVEVVLGSVGKGAEEHLSPSVSSAVPDVFSFGPVIERVVNDDNEKTDIFVDLDRGKLFSPPDMQAPNWPATLAWIRTNEIDSMGTLNANVRGLPCFDMIVAPLKTRQWDRMAAAEVQTALAWGTPGNPVFMTAKGELPATYLFQTREGGMGVLQIVGFTEDPKGVKIRYKMIQRGPEGEASALPAPAAVVRQFIRLALAGEGAAAVEFPPRPPSGRIETQTEPLRQIAEANPDWQPTPGQVIVLGDAAFVADAAELSDGRGDKGVLCFTLERQDGRWRITDIDFEDSEGVEDEIARFRQRHDLAHPTETQTAERLGKPVVVMFDQTPLSSAVGFMENVTKVPILLRRRDGIPRDDVTVTINVETTLGHALNLLCELTDLAWTVEGGGVVIAKPESLKAPPRTAPVPPTPPEVNALLQKEMPLQFHETPLRQVVEVLRHLAGVKVVLFHQDLPPDGAPVTLDVTTSLAKALEHVCVQSGLAWKVEGPVIKIGKARRIHGPEFTFGPVLERTVENMQAFDFDTGRILAKLGDVPPSEVEAALSRLRESGADVFGKVEGGRGGLPPVEGADPVDRVPDSTWTSPAHDVVGQIRSVMVSSFLRHIAIESPLEDAPSTWIFRTREGGMGILQITGFTDDPPGVRIRYKMVVARAPTGAGQAQADDPRAVASQFLQAIRQGDVRQALALTKDMRGLTEDILRKLVEAMRRRYAEDPDRLTQIQQVLTQGDSCIVRIDRLAGEEGYRYLMLVRYPEGWRVRGMDDSPSSIPLGERLEELVKHGADEVLQDEARRNVLKQRLHGLGLGIKMYAMDHDGTYPPDLAAVEALGYLGPENPLNSFNLGEQKVQYVVPKSDDPHEVMLYHWPPYKGGTWLLYQDLSLDWVQIDGQKLVNPRSGEVIRQAAEPAAALTFGPVIEQGLKLSQLLGRGFFLDLDTGDVISPPTFSGQGGAVWRELVQAIEMGADVYAESWGLNGRNLVCVDMAVRPLQAGQSFHSADPRMALRDAPDAVGDEESRKREFREGFPPGLSAAHRSYSTGRQGAYKLGLRAQSDRLVSFAFRTREGGIGVLQIVGFIEDSGGVKIRYKLVRSGAPPEPKDQDAEHGAAQEVAQEPQRRHARQ